VRIGKPPRIFRSTSSHRQYRNSGLGDRACVCSEAGRHDGQRSGNTCCTNNFWLRRARPNSRLRNRLDEAEAPVAAMLKMYPTMNRKPALFTRCSGSKPFLPRENGRRVAHGGTAGTGWANSNASRRLPLSYLPHDTSKCMICVDLYSYL
jgi:hypothetical protein